MNIKIPTSIEIILLSKYSTMFFDIFTKLYEDKSYYVKQKEKDKDEVDNNSFSNNIVNWSLIYDNIFNEEVKGIPKITYRIIKSRAIEAFRTIRQLARRNNLLLDDVGRYVSISIIYFLLISIGDNVIR